MAAHTYYIEEIRLNNTDYIETRIDKIWDNKTQSKVRDVLSYIYLDTANNCTKSKLRNVEHYLEPREIFLANWLTNKTDDSKGKLVYGLHAIKEAKGSRYSCRECKQADVRTLEIDHVDSNRQNITHGNFKCLCGNCHNIKTRQEGLLERVETMSDDKKAMIQNKF